LSSAWSRLSLVRLPPFSVSPSDVRDVMYVFVAVQRSFAHPCIASASVVVVEPPDPPQAAPRRAISTAPTAIARRQGRMRFIGGLRANSTAGLRAARSPVSREPIYHPEAMADDVGAGSPDPDGLAARLGRMALGPARAAARSGREALTTEAERAIDGLLAG